MDIIERRTTTILLADRVDVRGGRATYGQMVELGRVLDKARIEPADEQATLKALIRVLHPQTDPAINYDNVQYAIEIIQAVHYWKEKEAELLHYEPSPEEKAAGYEVLAAKTGPTSVAITLAEKFGVHNGPDEVFQWPYASVFMVLFIDLERYKFQKRLSDIRERKRNEKTSRFNKRR